MSCGCSEVINMTGGGGGDQQIKEYYEALKKYKELLKKKN